MIRIINIKSLLIPLLLLLTQLAYGQANYISGIVDCGTWIEARSLNRSSIFEASIQGYANGAAQATGIEVWHGKGVNTSPQSAYLFIDNYCRAHPLDSIWQGAWSFINEKT